MTPEDREAIAWLARLDPHRGMWLNVQSLEALVAVARAVEELLDDSPSTP